MDGLQVAQESQEKQAYDSRVSDKFPQPQTEPPSNPQTYQYADTTPVYPQPPHPITPPTNEEEKPLLPDRRHRVPFGLTAISYTLIVVAILVVILGAGLGGAIGAVASNNKDSCSSNDSGVSLGANSGQVTVTTSVLATATASLATATATSTGLITDYIPVAPESIKTTALNCSAGTSMYTTDGSQFKLYCDTNYAGNDMALLIAYSLDACVNACANMNSIAGSTKCFGVLFNSNMEQCVAQGGGNCWLKSAIGSSSVDGLPPSAAAILVTT